MDSLVIGVARGAKRALWRGMDGAAADFAVAALGAGAAFALWKNVSRFLSETSSAANTANKQHSSTNIIFMRQLISDYNKA